LADNAEDEDWRETLRKAAALVAACDTAPPWLAPVMQDALAIAGDLAPRSAVDSAPPAFYYPH